VAASVLDFVLEGLERALELERELGGRSIEIDRELLKAAEPPGGEAARGGTESSPRMPPPLSGGRQAASPTPPAPPAPPRPVSVSSPADLVFLHDRPLSEKGVEMMAKIIRAMGRTAANAPIVVVPPVPKAKIVVVLGGLALKKYFPEMRGEPGQWQKTPEGCDVLITYSPEYILRFATVTSAVEKIKKDMWHSLKAVVQRLR